MSHAIEIDSTTGIAAFVAAREEAWHRLGDFQADRLLTVAEAGDRAHLTGWDVRKVMAGALLDENDPLSWTPIPDTAAVIRNNPFNGQPEVLVRGTVGKAEADTGYQVFQNEETLDWASQIAGVFGDEEIVSAAGSILGGTRVFVSLSLEGFTVLGEDVHDQWLTVMNGHDGSFSLTALTGATRVVCKNTADWALSETTNRVKVRHSGDMTEKATAAIATLQVARDWATEYAAMAETLASQKMTERSFLALVDKHFGLAANDKDGNRTKARKVRDRDYLRSTFLESPTTEVGRGTRWAALNSITEWAEWGRPGDLTTEKAATVNLLGTPAATRQKAFALLVK